MLEPAEIMALSIPPADGFDEEDDPSATLDAGMLPGCAVFRTPSLSLVRMLQFGDSMLPIGGFAFSSGVESAVQKGVVHDAETLRRFTLTALEQAARGDAVAVAWGVRTVAGPGGEALPENRPEQREASLRRLEDIDHEVFARKLSEETRSMSSRMGKKLAEMSAHVTGRTLMAEWLERIRAGQTPGTYPATLALLFADLGMSVKQTLTVHQYGVAMTILNASLRLLRVTHLDTQAILFGLGPEFEAQCELAARLPLRQMSNYAPMTDILAAVHVRAHVRLFMN